MEPQGSICHCSKTASVSVSLWDLKYQNIFLWDVNCFPGTPPGAIALLSVYKYPGESSFSESLFWHGKYLCHYYRTPDSHCIIIQETPTAGIPEQWCINSWDFIVMKPITRGQWVMVLEPPSVCIIHSQHPSVRKSLPWNPECGFAMRKAPKAETSGGWIFRS